MDSYPILCIDDLLDHLMHMTIFSKIDLSQSYYQVAIEEKNKHKTALISRFGLFELNLLPFGPCSAPLTFQQFMNSSVDDLFDQCILVYLDDNLVYSRDATEYEGHLLMAFSAYDHAKCMLSSPNVILVCTRLNSLSTLLM